jgi:hypothetical protein
MHRTPIAPLRCRNRRYRQVRSRFGVGALTALLTSLEWPNKKPKEFHRALVSSFETLHHVIEPAAAREAFLPAAHAAGMPVPPTTWLRSGTPGKKRPDQQAGSFVLEIRCPDDSTIVRPIKLIQAKVISSEIE